MNLAELQAVLQRTPRVFASQLDGLPEAWTGGDTSGGDTSGGSWSARDVVAHLVQGEVEDWVPRAQLLLEHGTARTFTPFDPEGFRVSEAGRALPELLRRLADLRAENLGWLAQQAFTAPQLELRGTHPEFGPVTLLQLLWTWAAHDLSHIGQLARILARRVGVEVGPWAAYLPLLTRTRGL